MQAAHNACSLASPSKDCDTIARKQGEIDVLSTLLEEGFMEDALYAWVAKNAGEA